MSEMKIDEVIAKLPHRYPFLLVDRVLEYTPGERLTAVKNVSINEPFFNGHFPDQPVMPGVLILESMAQAAGILALLTTGSVLAEGELFFFAGIDNARFKRVVIPGDQLRLEVEVIRVKKELCKMKGTATVDGELACSAELMSVKRKQN